MVWQRGIQTNVWDDFMPKQEPKLAKNTVARRSSVSKLHWKAFHCQQWPVIEALR